MLLLTAPKGGSKKQCPKFEPYIAVITPKRYKIGCHQLVLITNRKSHAGFRLIPTSMTLNDLERRGDWPVMSAKYCLPLPVFHFRPN